MIEQLVDQILTSQSKEIDDLKTHIKTLKGFLELIQKIDGLKNINKRFYEESRSLYQVTAVGHSIEALERLLSEFFGPPVKPAGKSTPRKLRKQSTVVYLGGIQKDQSLFIKKLKTGEFYGALWPWQRNKKKIEIHLGYCSDWMTDSDYAQLETLVKKTISRRTFQQMEAGVGGKIKGISLPSFLQMSEMEKSNFTLKVVAGENMGYLYLKEGSLIAAQVDEMTGREAAYRIISWDEPIIEIQPPDESKSDEIKQPLMHVLMESLKMKDEAAYRQPPAGEAIGPDHSPPPEDGRGRKPGRPIVKLERAPAPPPVKDRSGLVRKVVWSIVGLLVVAVGAASYYFHVSANRSADRFAKFIARADSTESARQRLDMLENFLKKHPNTAWRKQLQQRIEDAREQIEDQEYEQTTLKVSSLPLDENYEKKAIEIYTEFLKKHPDSRHIDRINKAIAGIKDLLDQYYYQELQQAARLDFAQRLRVYREYLERFPRGRYRRDVQILIDEMADDYLAFLKQQAAVCIEQRRWDDCLAKCDVFIKAFSGSPKAWQAEEIRKKVADSRDWWKLKNRILEAGDDFKTIRDLLQAYLKENPDSTVRSEVEAELKKTEVKLREKNAWLALQRQAHDEHRPIDERIRRLKLFLAKNKNGPYASDARDLLEALIQQRGRILAARRMEAKRKELEERKRQQRLELRRRQRRLAALRREMIAKLEKTGRFVPNGDETVTDKVTGLTWCVLDSFQELEGCLNYKEALSYVKSLSAGGYTDWRLPTASELASIYKQAPFFPQSGAKWYWSSEAYVKGYYSVANIVTAKRETVFERLFKRQDQCGAVRAVRP